MHAVKKASTRKRRARTAPNFVLGPHRRGQLHADVEHSIDDRLIANGEAMSVVAYILLTVAIFGLLGLAQRLVEHL